MSSGLAAYGVAAAARVNLALVRTMLLQTRVLLLLLTYVFLFRCSLGNSSVRLDLSAPDPSSHLSSNLPCTTCRPALLPHISQFTITRTQNSNNEILQWLINSVKVYQQ